MSSALSAFSALVALAALAACQADPPAEAPAQVPVAEVTHAAPTDAAPRADGGSASPTGKAGALELGDPYYPGLGNGGYEVEHYDLALDLELDSDELTGLATLRANALQALTSFSL
ncbi:MAG: hypothetical protein ABL998_15130, partial [Planctomycetota bacterium]